MTSSPSMTNLAASLVEPVREGTFPDSASVLSTELDSDAINQLLESIAKARDELNADLREVSQPYVGGVDEWIAQAKRAQDDIVRCKQAAQHIVQEHDRLEQLRAEASEAKRTAESLSDEIGYSKELQAQLQDVSSVWQQLQSIEASLSSEDLLVAAQAVTDTARPVAALRGPSVNRLFTEYRDDVLLKTRKKLETLLSSRITVQYDASGGALVVEDALDRQPSNEDTVAALIKIGSADRALEAISERIEAFVLRILFTKSSRHLNFHDSQKGRLSVTFGESPPSLPLIFSFTSKIALFLRANLPAHLSANVISSLAPRLISGLITDWLTPAIPTDLDQIDQLDSISTDVTDLAHFLDAQEWPNAGDLTRWTQHAPRMWISIRKSEALNAVRKAFAQSRGSLHQVERVERRKASKLNSTQPNPTATDDAHDDWNTTWDDENKSETPERKLTTDEDTSGWGFDDDMDDEQSRTTASDPTHSKMEDVDDAEDAWGWGDDDAEAPKPAPSSKSPHEETNGDGHDVAESQELVMSELYSITDIPDILVESIGKDIQDATTLQREEHASLRGVPAPAGLLALPSLSLAMFRATAPIHYSKTLELGNMNLYNDSLYIADKLRHMPATSGMNDIEKDSVAMEKFARGAYAREMDTQRTILGDLLDGVQGFTIPYAEQIEDAIAATSDRLRQVHADWSPILSTSALLQSIGALLASVLSKVITDVEEMDDISEAQSQRLTNFCGQLAKLEDLFISRPSEESQSDQEPVAMVAVYCFNWLRFQYLVNILESNLQDIKYLWTEGELSLEFSEDEVVDLIKALFAESSHRRSAIAAIRGHRGSGL